MSDCALCPPKRVTQARDGGQTCWSCHDRLADIIREIVLRYSALDPTPGSSGVAERRAPGFRSQPPLNLHVVALSDPRTRVLTPGDPACAWAVYRLWANLIRRERGQDSQLNSLQVEEKYLLNSLDWLTRQPEVVGFSAEIERVCTQLRAATGEPNPKPVGWCIELLDAGSPSARYCGHPLFPPRKRGAEVLECAGCGAEYDFLRQARLALSVRSGPPTPPCRCGHDDPQHDNDSAGRPCNVRWCGCITYRPEQEVA